MRTIRQVSIVIMAIVVMTVGLAIPAHAGTEGAFVSEINASRAAAGLPPVSSHSDLVPDARAHSAEMMAAGQIYHSSNLGSVASGWEGLAENVGAGPSVNALHTEFMNSSGHRRNILGDFNYVGVGVAMDGDQIWVTVIFMKKGSSAPTTTTTTPPPTTTTTTTTTTVPLPVVPDEPTTTTVPPEQASLPSVPTSPRTPAAPAPDGPAPTPSPAGGTAEAAAVMKPFVQAPHRPIVD